jgi:alkanesulfonate monooxygenase SsuD/methylene tetrahydromethanopterin reductase-like flavin-dependent oxidoreductase (luciferase family)
LSIGGERRAIGVPPAERGGLMDEALPVLRQLWSGESVSHEGPSGSFNDISVSPRPVQDPFDVWLGGNAPAALERCGRLGDGWLPALCTPEEAAAGKQVIDRVAAEHGRAISPEHFGVSIVYAPPGTDLRAESFSTLTRRARGRSLDQIIPVGLDALRSLLLSYVDVGFSKFIVRPLAPPPDWRPELEALAAGVVGLQT